MTTTRYYIERETAITKEWIRIQDLVFKANEKGFACTHAEECPRLYKNIYRSDRYRVVEVTETVVGVYG